MSLNVAEFISGDSFTTRSRISALTVHASTLLSCLKYTALDRLRVRLNVVLLLLLVVNAALVIRSVPSMCVSISLCLSSLCSNV